MRNREYAAILGPFAEPPIENLNVSPFMTRNKPNAAHRRVIIDLSFPIATSVNAGVTKDTYLETPYQLNLPNLDVITNQVKKLGPGCSMYKVDISRAFRHVKLHPYNYDLLGLRHNYYYVDTYLLFGYRHGTTLFQHISDAVTSSHASVKFKTLLQCLSLLLQELGFKLNEKKKVSPTTHMNYLGIIVDTKTFTISIPTKKLQQI